MREYRGLHYCLVIGALCFGSSPVYAQAQEKFPLVSGDHIRVIVDNSQGASYKVQGRFISVRNDTLFLREDAQTFVLWVPCTSIISLAKSIGTRSNIGKGAGVGFLAGVLVGAFVMQKANETSFEDLSNRDAALMGAGVGGISGMVIGMIVGAVNSGEVWATVPLQAPRLLNTIEKSR